MRSSGQHKQAGTDIYNWLTLSSIHLYTQKVAQLHILDFPAARYGTLTGPFHSSTCKQKFVVKKLINNNSNFVQQKHRMKNTHLFHRNKIYIEL